MAGSVRAVATECQLVGQVLSPWVCDCEGERKKYKRLTIGAVGIELETLGANQLETLRVFSAIVDMEEAIVAKNGDF